jgi:hypothetical protein
MRDRSWHLLLQFCCHLLSSWSSSSRRTGGRRLCIGAPAAKLIAQSTRGQYCAAVCLNLKPLSPCKFLLPLLDASFIIEFLGLAKRATSILLFDSVVLFSRKAMRRKRTVMTKTLDLSRGVHQGISTLAVVKLQSFCMEQRYNMHPKDQCFLAFV